MAKAIRVFHFGMMFLVNLRSRVFFVISDIEGEHLGESEIAKTIAYLMDTATVA